MNGISCPAGLWLEAWTPPNVANSDIYSDVAPRSMQENDTFYDFGPAQALVRNARTSVYLKSKSFCITASKPPVQLERPPERHSRFI